ncbi:hypothetical protein [Rhodococcus sp. T7]|uniref:hypothetical protein n=1 Tax=Rhodococcus sp. T7 TaxID=627444 RepID=UPI00135C5136|nr:hypothetical protein [Rhodococcus sp. T7]KAF0957642.1 hypothetical protein MLGJGCBP_09474 [Rhodococcus sp. T7]KAF0963286.1 hypothetical protein MLGJGCBP_03592 [Rhodococcus sp. T7]
MTSLNGMSRPALRVAAELNGYGHHPALSTDSRTGRPESRWVDLRGADDEGGLPHDHATIVRIQAADMAQAHRERATLRSEIQAKGGHPDDIAVLVDIAVLIAPQARSARKELLTLDSTLAGPRPIESLEYIGTPIGLASLIADLYVVGVVDGVTLLPLSEPAVVDHVVNESLPWLTLRGVYPPVGGAVLARTPLR